MDNLSSRPGDFGRYVAENMNLRTSISTSTFSKAYLAPAWEQRAGLEDYERRGFVQFVYLTICGHLEDTLAQTIKKRCHSIKHLLQWDRLPPKEYRNNGVDQKCDQQPVWKSLLGLIGELERETLTAPLGKLIQLYNRCFDNSLKTVVGNDLYADLDAIASLRNLFAHGRNLYFDSDGINLADPITLDSNPIQKPALRLHAMGIIGDLDFTHQNIEELRAAIYADDAILHFYNATRSIEQAVVDSIAFPPEKDSMFVRSLPDIVA